MRDMKFISQQRYTVFPVYGENINSYFCVLTMNAIKDEVIYPKYIMDPICRP